MISDKESFSLYAVAIDFDADKRIDKYRAHHASACSLHPATLQDGGNAFTAVAKITAMTSAKGRERLKLCAEINRSLHDHQNIIKVHGIQQGKDWFTLLIEEALCSSRDIVAADTPQRKQWREEVLSKMSMKDIFYEACVALAYVHSKTDDVNDHISHRDIKPENILIVPQKRDGTYTAKLTDFDSAKQLEVDSSVNITTANVFTEEYQDPNVIKLKAAGQTVVVKMYLGGDVRALGLSGFEYLGDGTHMFQGKNRLEMLNKIDANDRSNLIESNIDELAKNLLYTMTQ